MGESIKQIQTRLLKSSLFKGTAGFFALKMTYTGLTFVTSVVLARLLGAYGLGIYSYVFSWVGLLVTPAILGLNELLVREVAIAKSEENYGLLKGLLQWTNAVVICVAFGMAILAGIVFRLIGSDASEPMIFYLALVVLPFNALGSLRTGAMKGLKKAVLGTIPEALINPLLFLGLIALGYWLRGDRLDVSLIVWIKIFTSATIFIIGTIWLTKLAPKEIVSVKAIYRPRSWLSSSLPLMILGFMQVMIARSDILMLGSMKGASAVSIYVVVRYGTEFIIFVQTAANNVLSPHIASLVAEGRKPALQRIVTKGSAMIFAASLLIGLFLVAFSDQILGLFGPEFVAGKTALIILAIGQLVNTSVGPVGKLLAMGGYEKHTATSVTCSGILNIVLNALMIPHWGVNGAAIATATSIIILNLVELFLVRTKLGIDSAAWSILRQKNL